MLEPGWIMLRQEAYHKLECLQTISSMFLFPAVSVGSPSLKGPNRLEGALVLQT